MKLIKKIFKNLDEFNNIQRKIFKDIQTKSREEAIQGFKKENNLNNFQANSLHYVYNYLLDNFDKINSKYVTKKLVVKMIKLFYLLIIMIGNVILN